MQDGHELGWKLAWAAQGCAGEPLLASYAAERGPVGERRARRSVAPGQPDPADGLLGDLGVGYASPVLAGAAPRSSRPDDLAAEPGERAPHVWVHVDGRRCSTLDLWGGRLTLDDRRPDPGARPPRTSPSPLRTSPARRRWRAPTGSAPAGRSSCAPTARRLAGDVAVADPVGVLSDAVEGALGLAGAGANGEFVRVEAANSAFVATSRATAGQLTPR